MSSLAGGGGGRDMKARSPSSARTARQRQKRGSGAIWGGGAPVSHPFPTSPLTNGTRAAPSRRLAPQPRPSSSGFPHPLQEVGSCVRGLCFCAAPQPSALGRYGFTRPWGEKTFSSRAVLDWSPSTLFRTYERRVPL